ncbi:MAG: hypothetical protein JOZ62_23895, partial [Acidobacteriaceae bacterium]|nr:hypothetical protein [Acidobacteriaceae bacterium]
IIASDWAPAELRQYTEAGGHVLLASSRPPDFSIAPVVKTWTDIKGYVRVRAPSMFPSLEETELLMISGPFTEIAQSNPAILTLVPPSKIGPPELVHIDQKDTVTPGLVFKQIGAGTVAWIPWNLGALYYRLSLPAHAGLFRDVLDRLCPHRQLTTNAHPLVEITSMEQNGRHLLHLLNLSGHSQTGYFKPVEMRDIHIEVAGKFQKARTVRNPIIISTRVRSGSTAFDIPRLDDYELVVLE